MFASFCTFVQIFVLARTRQRVHVQVYAEPCRYLRVSWNLPPFHRESLYKNPFCHHTQCLLYREKPFSICKMPPLAAIVEVLHFWQCWLGSNDCISGQLCYVVLSCSDRKKLILNGCINRIIYYLLQPQIATSQLRGTAQNKHISIYRSLVSYFKWSDESVGFLRLNLHASTCHSHLHSPGTQSAHVLKQHFPTC